MVKMHINITIDIETYLEARKRNLNISNIVNDLLKSYLELPSDKAKADVGAMNAEIMRLRAEAAKIESNKRKLEKDSSPKPKVSISGEFP